MPDDEIDQWVRSMDLISDNVLTLRKRGTTIWNRAGRGEPPLTNAEIKRMRAALARLQRVART